MKIVFSRKCLEYDSPGHPESSERVRKTYEFLKKHKFEFVKPEECSRQDLLLIHSEKLVDKIKHGRFVNFETPSLPDIYSHAKLAVGGAILAMETALKEDRGFSLMRPPGHHAGKTKFGGFCYFNNIAIAVAKALKNIKKAAILDIDVHHGNGTQDIFLGNSKVIYVSLHQYGFFYPGTGKHSEANCYNYPLASGTGEEEYLKKLEVGVEKIREFDPDMLAISAGFDTFEHDPLAGLKLKIESYSKISKLISELEKPRFAVLEGGYSRGLHECVHSFLKKF
ncbi:MAG: histone deacetylase [Candidatus Aenigmatarchaeota archaeon]|nr:MAG: histone deacetylase [Candidatus Aenigmarchaeota archaeon]